jgi:hypothetical protein
MTNRCRVAPLVAGLAILAGGAFAVQEEGLKVFTRSEGGYQFTNGHGWVLMSSQVKINFLKGIWDGVAVTIEAFNSMPKDAPSRTFARSTSIGELNSLYSGGSLEYASKEIDEFYKQSQNFQIPVYEAWQHVVLKYNGKPPEELAKDQARLWEKYKEKK